MNDNIPLCDKMSPIVCMTEYTYLEYIDGSNVSVCQTLADTLWSKTFFLGGTLAFFAFPLAILVIIYFIISINLMTHPGIIPISRLENPTSAQRYRKKVVMMLGTVVIFFFICLLPFRALIVWIVLVPHEEVMKLGNEGYYSLLYFCRIMFYLNSAINPILYNLMSSKFRNGFLKLCGIKRNCFRKHTRALLRTSTFNTSSLTAFTTSSLHRTSIADLNHHHKDRKKILKDQSLKKKISEGNNCSKSPHAYKDLSSSLKNVRLRNLLIKTNADKIKIDHFKFNHSKKKKISRRKSFSDFCKSEENTTFTLDHSQSMDSIFKKFHRGNKKSKCLNSSTYNEDGSYIVRKTSNKYISVKDKLVSSSFNSKSNITNMLINNTESVQILKIFKVNSNKRKTAAATETIESFV